MNRCGFLVWLFVGAGCELVSGINDLEPQGGASPGVGGGGQGAGGSDLACSAGEKESCYSGASGTVGKGVCVAGTRSCGADGFFGACVGEVLPKAEDCTAPTDDDCDGVPDDGCSCEPGFSRTCFSADATLVDVGICKAGVQTCDDDGAGYGACDGEVTPQTEDCGTALDDDCDGEVNESEAGCVCTSGEEKACFDGPGTAGVGNCAAGTQVCAQDGLSFSACNGQISAQTELCGNGQDDDCDGSVDEGCACDPGGAPSACYTGPAETNGQGNCQGGLHQCNPDGLSFGPCNGEVLPGTESCDVGLADEDCDGLVNESGTGCVCTPGATLACYDGSAATRNIGQCTEGVQTCAADGRSWSACAGQVLPSAEENCAGAADEDCNGLTNNASEGCSCVPGSVAACYTGPAGTSGVGTCKDGTQTCASDGKGYGACGGMVVPVGELCGDSKDNDCNGNVDNGCPITGVKQVGAGENSSCAVMSDDTVSCWGKYSTSAAKTVATPVNGVTGVVEVDCGDSYCCARLSNQTVKCWGSNVMGQLGNGTTTSSTTPVVVSGLSTVTGISVAEGHACAVLSSGEAKCWGGNGSGELGDNSSTNRSTPVTMQGLTGVTLVAAGWNHTCAKANEDFYCSGENFWNQLGNAVASQFDGSLIPLEIGISGGSRLEAGGFHTCLTAGTTVACFGGNFEGQLGNGDTSSTGDLQLVGGGGTFATSLGAGLWHSCAAAPSGSVSCWGNNDVGQLGDGTNTSALTPVSVSGLSGVTQIDLDRDHGCARLGSGAVKCWGRNTQGQLGNGTNANSNVPVSVLKP